MKKIISLTILLIPFILFWSSFGKTEDKIYQKGFLSIEEARKSIELPQATLLNSLFSEPQIKEPVAMAWKGNGVFYVVEMRTYMQTANPTEMQTPKRRISNHKDTNVDRTYDKSTVFIYNLLLPRMVLRLDDG